MTDTAGSISLAKTRHSSKSLSEYLTVRVVLRAAIAAAIIGTVLTLTNQSDALFGTDDWNILPLGIVFLTPFVVVTISQQLGARQAAFEATRDSAPESGPETGHETFIATAAAHGIPKRALVVGSLAAGINATIVATATYLEQCSVRELPLPLLSQAFVLPVLFGILSQALSYRRAIAAFRRAEASLNR